MALRLFVQLHMYSSVSPILPKRCGGRSAAPRFSGKKRARWPAWPQLQQPPLAGGVGAVTFLSRATRGVVLAGSPVGYNRYQRAYLSTKTAYSICILFAYWRPSSSIEISNAIRSCSSPGYTVMMMCLATFFSGNTPTTPYCSSFNKYMFFRV